MDELKHRAANLLALKSMVTLIFTITSVFTVLWIVVRTDAVPEWFVEMFKVIIVFYFGTQFEKAKKG